MSEVTIESDLGEVFDRFYADAYDQEVEKRLADVLGESITEFKDTLRGNGKAPGEVWPIGTVKKAKTSGRNYYVKPGTKGSRRSGRSLREWRSKIVGTSAVVFNNARDPRGVRYARFVHLAKPRQRPGLTDGLGAAANAARDTFTEVMTKAGEDMAEILSDHMGAK